LAAYWAEVLGGPTRYSDECNNQSALLVMHSGNGDMSDLSRRFVECFDAAVDDAGLPDDRDFRAALHDFMEWAVAVFNSHPDRDASIPPDLKVPRWSWEGLVS
jgi:hemoglobin